MRITTVFSRVAEAWLLLLWLVVPFHRAASQPHNSTGVEVGNGALDLVNTTGPSDEANTHYPLGREKRDDPEGAPLLTSEETIQPMAAHKDLPLVSTQMSSLSVEHLTDAKRTESGPVTIPALGRTENPAASNTETTLHGSKPPLFSKTTAQTIEVTPTPTPSVGGGLTTGSSGATLPSTPPASTAGHSAFGPGTSESTSGSSDSTTSLLDPASPSPDPASPSPDPASPSPDPASPSPDPASPSPDSTPMTSSYESTEPTGSSAGAMFPGRKSGEGPAGTTRAKRSPLTSPAGGSTPPADGGYHPCSPLPPHRHQLVNQCLIAIATLAAVAVVFIISTVVLCTKLSATRHRHRLWVGGEHGTEMVCISALLPDGELPHGRPRIPKSNGALIASMEDSEGDDLTLHSFLPENDRTS